MVLISKHSNLQDAITRAGRIYGHVFIEAHRDSTTISLSYSEAEELLSSENWNAGEWEYWICRYDCKLGRLAAASIAAIIFLMLAGCATIHKYATPVEPCPHTAAEIHKICPACRECKPFAVTTWTTLIYCGDCDCCSTTTWIFECRNTGSSFTIPINECDVIIWGMYQNKNRLTICEGGKLSRSCYY